MSGGKSSPIVDRKIRTSLFVSGRLCLGMSEEDSSPKYSVRTRKRIAISKYYGLDGTKHSYKEISNLLNVSPRQVRRYIHESSVGAEAEKMLAEKEASARFQIYQQLSRKLDRLSQVEEELLKKKDAVPSSFSIQDAKGMVSFDQVPNMAGDYENGEVISAKVPIADDFVEVTDTDELKDVWREQRQVIEQMEDLLGLEEPDKIEQTGQQVIDVKHWSMDGNIDNLPDQEVVDVDSSFDQPNNELPEGDVDSSWDGE